MSDGMSKPKYKYMPAQQFQQLTSALACEGRLVMYELTTQVFHPGVRAFASVVQNPDKISLVRLFVFLLQTCCNCNATVVLERVVPESKKTLSTNQDDIAYRLWIALTPSQEAAFLWAVNDMIAPVAVTADTSKDSVWNKRRRCDSVYDKQFGPEYAKHIDSVRALTQIVKLYYGGTRPIDQATGSMTAVSAEGSDEDSSNTLSYHLEAKAQFTSPTYAAHCTRSGIMLDQRDYSNYVGRDPDTNLIVFDPAESIRPFLRVLVCGTDKKSFIQLGVDIFKYLRPGCVPSGKDILSKQESIDAARGLTTSELSVGSLDPHEFSPMEGTSYDAESSDIGVYELEKNRQYFAIAAQGALTEAAFKDAVTSELGEKVYRDSCRDIKIMLSEESYDGCPSVYNELYKWSNDIIDNINHADKGSEFDLARQSIFRVLPNTETKHGLSAMITTLIAGSGRHLGLQRHQYCVNIFLYISSFAVTFNHMRPSLYVVLTGPPSTGKSYVSQAVMDTIAPPLVMLNDAASELAMTVFTSANDLRFVYQDESKVSKESSSSVDVSNKLTQSQLSIGMVTYFAKIHDPTTGQWVLAKKKVIHRTTKVTCTNNADSMSPAILSRATLISIPMDLSIREKIIHVSKNASIIDRNRAARKRASSAWKLVLKYYSALQYRYTAFEACNVIPPMNNSLLVLFWYMLFEEFGDDHVPARRQISLNQFAESVRVFDLITMWHSRGIGKKHEYKFDEEIMFYAANAYTTAESIVIAYRMMERTSAPCDHVDKMMTCLKDSIDSDGAIPAIDDEYYVSKVSSKASMIAFLKRFMRDVGDGVIKATLNEIEGTVDPATSLPIVKIGKIANDKDRYMFLRSAMSNYRTDTERAVIAALRRVYVSGKACHRSYDDEETHVAFEQSVRVSLLKSDESSSHPELDKKTTEQVQHAFAFLGDMLDSNSNPLFMAVEYYEVAKYGARSVDPGVKQSKVRPGEFYTRADLWQMIVVSLELLSPERSKTTKTDAFIVKFLTIAGGYDNGKAVFSDLALTSSRLCDHSIVIPAGSKTSVRMSNSNYENPAYKYAMADEEEEPQEAECILENELWPRHVEIVTFTETSMVESKVANMCFARSKVPERLRHDYLLSHHTY